MKKSSMGIKHIFQAFIYSYQGLKATFKSETAFRQDLLVFGIGLLVSFLLPLSGIERALMTFSLFLILLMELINTAIETVIDRISEKHHPLSGRAKDIGSALVFMAFINAIVVWCLILF